MNNQTLDTQLWKQLNLFWFKHFYILVDTPHQIILLNQF